MKYQHYIWDFDGTLFNSYPHMNRSLQRALQEYGVQETADEIIVHLKVSVSKAITYYREKYGLDDRLSSLYSKHEQFDEKSLISPYPGAAEVCSKICNMGGFNYIYTHRSNSALDYLKQFGMNDYFRDAVTKENDFPRKPAPDAIQYLSDKYHINKSEMLMVGDRDIDILSGHNAGVEACLFDPENFYPNFPTGVTVTSMKEFDRLLLETV